MVDETRRAPAAFKFEPAGGSPPAQGEAQAVAGDDAISVGPISIAWLDADTVVAADYRITIDCWPGGRLHVSQLGRRFDSFAAALGRARNQARVVGLLAHAPSMPEVFQGAVLGGGVPVAAELHVYPTHVTVVPEGADPWQVAHGALIDLATGDQPPSVVLVTADARTVIGQLARKRDAFREAVAAHRDAQTALLARYTGQPGFTDGRGVARGAIASFDSLLMRCASPERVDGARTLLASSRGGEPRLGFVQLLDPDNAGTTAGDPLPQDWASFLLVPVDKLVVLEILAGPGAATYLFERPLDEVNRDLQTLHFRRAGLALTAEQAQITPTNPHRLALRRLAPLQRLRAATRARLVHSEQWPDALSKALAGA